MADNVRKHRHRTANLALFVFACGLFWPLCLGRTLYWGDILLYFLPMYRFGQEVLQHGQLPLWNSRILLGQPYIGNPQMGVFYPSTFLLLFMSVPVFLSFTTILHFFLCGALAYQYLRRWVTTASSACAGAMVYMGSACLVGRAQFPPMIVTAAYFPWLLLCVDMCLDQPDVRVVLMLAVCIGLTVLAAHAQMAYLSLGCGLIYTVARLAAAKRHNSSQSSPSRRMRVFGALAIGSALGIMVTLVQTLPAVQLLVESPREHLTPWQANRFVLEPTHLLTLIWPHFFGHPALSDYWGGGNAWEPAIYVGWLPLLLAGYAAIQCQAREVVRFWLVVGGISIWLALGTAGGLFWLAYAFVPGVSNFHDPARFLYLTTFGTSVLTAVGLDAARKRYSWISYRITVIALVAIGVPLLWYGQEWNPTITPAELNKLLVTVRYRIPTSTADSLDRLYLPAQETFWERFVNDGYVDYGASDPQVRRTFAGSLTPNLSMFTAREAVSGYEPVPMSAPAVLDSLAIVALKRGEPNFARLGTLLQAQTIITPASRALHDPRLSTVQRDPTLWRGANGDSTGRAWLVHNVECVQGKIRLAAAVAAPQFDPKRTAIVSETRPVPFALGEPTPPDNYDMVRLVTSSATSYQYRVQSHNRSGFLVVSSAAYPGWTVRLDGKPTHLWRAYGALMGVVVPSGAHSLHFQYAPAVFRLALFLSLNAVSALVFLGAARLFRDSVRSRRNS